MPVTLWIRTGNNTIRHAKPGPRIKKVIHAGEVYKRTGRLEGLQSAVADAESYIARIMQPKRDTGT